MTAYRVHCPDCRSSTTVHLSDGAAGAVANCDGKDCGRSWLVCNSVTNLPPVEGEEAEP